MSQLLLLNNFYVQSPLNNSFLLLGELKIPLQNYHALTICDQS